MIMHINPCFTNISNLKLLIKSVVESMVVLYTSYIKSYCLCKLCCLNIAASVRFISIN